MAQQIEKINIELDQINKERIFWLRISVFVSMAVLGIIWNCNSTHINWVLLSLALGISVIWWYWTMRIIRITLDHRRTEVEILHGIIDDIKEIKTKVAELPK
jgi:uncharacterized membrane protein